MPSCPLGFCQHIRSTVQLSDDQANLPPLRVRAGLKACTTTAREAPIMQLNCGRRRRIVPEQETLKRARRDKRQGKAPTTQAGEFVREEMHHIHEGKHGARSTKQAVAIGLSKARRAGVKLAAPKKGRASAQTRKQAQRDLRRGRSSRSAKPSPKRSRASLRALKRERGVR